MTETFNVLMVGVGGQGIVMASDVLAEAAMMEGLDVKKSEIHGMSMRGGPVFSHVRFGKAVFAPVISKGEAHVLFSLESMEVLRWAEWAGPECAVCYLANEIKPVGEEAYPSGVDEEISRLFGKRLRIDPEELSGRIASPKTENSVLLGALSTLVPLQRDSLESALSGRCPPDTVDINLAAFDLGRRLAFERIGASHVE